MNRCQVLNGVEADPEDCAFGDEVAPDMHIARSDPVRARGSRVQPQRLLQAALQQLDTVLHEAVTACSTKMP